MKEEYLTVAELSERIKYSVQSLYNLINNGSLKLKRHYLKPTPKKILFKWTAILQWMGEDITVEEPTQNFALKKLPPTENFKSEPKNYECAIKI